MSVVTIATVLIIALGLQADALRPRIVRDRDRSGSGTSHGRRECHLDGARRGGRDAPAAIIFLAERRRGDDARDL